MCAVNPKWAKFIFHWSCASDPVDGAHDTPPQTLESIGEECTPNIHRQHLRRRAPLSGSQY